MKLFSGLFTAAALIGCAALSAAPAAAQDSYVFGTSAGGTSATLTFDGVTPFTSVNTGWVNAQGLHYVGNQNYLVGTLSGVNYNDYFNFALGALAPASPYTSATLTIATTGNSVGALPQLLTLFDVNASLADLTVGRSVGDAKGMALYNDLGSGTSYGNYSFASRTVAGGAISIALNQTFLNQVNSGLLTNFSIGGTLTPTAPAVPEPATWGMMILGMGAIGFAMRRRVRVSEAKFNTKIKRIVEGEVAA